ncbi:MAG TPA: mitochondrial fission ELM1 family protein [Micropepsaceae bacterium]|nr:mitochondrial fission ELM1 family protein [Micropepsaceae bacterium]
MLSCWVVTDGKAGMDSQCLGLAEALGLTPVMKRVALRKFWRAVTPYIRLGGTAQFATDGDALAPPWPDILIASGRQSVAAALWVKKRSRGRTIAIQVQNPGIARRRFDLIIAPEHDRLAGPNVISTRGALHRVTPAMLSREGAAWSPRFSSLPRPYIAVLMGGSNPAYRLGRAEAAVLAAKLKTCARTVGGSLLITPSRRTGQEAIAALAAGVRSAPFFVWDMQGENPYFALLALADYIVVTCDSVNMVSEAASTGKPVYVEMLPGGSAKSARFLDRLRADGIIRNFSGALMPYDYPPLDDMTKAVERIRSLIGAWKQPGSDSVSTIP